jgi:hypothetical protein
MICDLAETYQIYDYERVPARTLGILVSGLRHDSRVEMAKRGEDYPLDSMLLASIVDSVNTLIYGFFMKKSDKPDSFVELLTRKDSEGQIEPFESGEEFMKWRNSIVKEN